MWLYFMSCHNTCDIFFLTGRSYPGTHGDGDSWNVFGRSYSEEWLELSSASMGIMEAGNSAFSIRRKYICKRCIKTWLWFLPSTEKELNDCVPITLRDAFIIFTLDDQGVCNSKIVKEIALVYRLYNCIHEFEYSTTNIEYSILNTWIIHFTIIKA